MAARGHEAKRQRDEAYRQTIQTLVASPQLDYPATRLARVRGQLDRLDLELQRCSLSDSKRIKELTDASTRLSEQERILAGRPLPGTKRPPAEGGRRSREVAALLVDEVRPSSPPVVMTEVAQVVQPAPVGQDQPSTSKAPSTLDRLPGDVTP